MSVILIRHGRVEKTQGLPLSADGSSFASGLSGAFSAQNIRKIMSTSDAHCQATLEPLSRSLGIGIDTYSSADEVAAAIRQGDWAMNDIIVLFRMGNAARIFAAAGIPGQSPGSSDEAYGNIWVVNPESRTVSTSPTGF